MSSRQPPRFAEFLLDWLADNDEGLRGDLLEEFDAGRSRGWYWRQTLGAIGASRIAAARAAGISGLESVVTGLSMLVILGIYVVYVVNVTEWLLRTEGVNVIGRVPGLLGAFDGGAPILTLLVGIVLGRLIGSGATHHRIIRIVAFGATTMMCAILGLQAVTTLGETAPWLPSVPQQIITTGAFVIGLVGGVGTTKMVSPAGIELAQRPR